MKLPFNLSKQARRGSDPPEAFNQGIKDPYGLKRGKPGSGEGSDLTRPGSVGFSNQAPSSGGGISDNKEWPSDRPFFDDEDGYPKRDNGTGIVTDHGLLLHDDAEIGQGSGQGSGDAVLGVNETVTREMTNNRDRPFNLTNNNNPLKEVRPRLRSLNF